MKYISLKNMSDEEKKARKRKQKNEASKRYYQKHKDYYKNYSKQWAKDKLKSLENEIEELKAELQEANDSIIWWQNRYNALYKNSIEIYRTEPYDKIGCPSDKEHI